MFGSPSPPKIPPPLPQPKVGVDPAELADLARKRRALQSKRKGRSALRVDPKAQPQTGLRIPMS